MDALPLVGRNAELLDLTGVSARYVDQVGTVADDGSWSAVAELTWQVAGFDQEPSSAEVVVDLAPADGGLAVTGFGRSGGPGDGPGTSAGARLPLWLSAELTVIRRSGTLVAVDGDRAEAREVARRVARGRDVVRRVLPRWRGGVVVEVPAGGAGLDRALGVAPGTYDGIAAVTAPAGAADDDVAAPVHVFVNPDVTERLRRAGAQVVMSHELVHVATDAVRSPAEPWLVEGFADYVALRNTALPDRTTLGRAIAAARRDGLPGSLPGAAAFDTAAPGLQARYEEAWLACRVIAERLGERGLVEVYDAALAGEPLADVLERAGLTETALTSAWRARLRELTG